MFIKNQQLTANMSDQTPILSREKMITYAENRLFTNLSSNTCLKPGEIIVTPDMVNTIELHNGIHGSQLEQTIRERYGEPKIVAQSNAREPIYYRNNCIFISQTSGINRQERYVDTILTYIKASRRKIKFKQHYLNNSIRQTNIHYEFYAYDFVVGLIVPESKHEDRRIFPEHDAKHIDRIIFGNLDAVAKQADNIVARVKTDYLDAQIVRINNQDVLSIGYVYGDQASYLIDKLLREYASLAAEERVKRTIDLFFFGRVAGIKQGMKPNDLVFPTATINEKDLFEHSPPKKHFQNMLASGDRECVNLDANSVVGETFEMLKLARAAGCKSVDLEVRKTAASAEREREIHHKNLNLRLHLVGHVYDIPLDDLTIEEEIDCEEGEQKAVEHFKSFII